ncbi:HhH-GPD-type base excision DNA repair protein [Kitasatospora sp. NPDC001309]|uniref:HhH-GPD-type base excision DNA repair protein n=1 Tax=Kitasatospora sp. NPDC001309 TaxID=3364013 RepID=UPI003685B7DF
MNIAVRITQQAEADALLSRSALALLVGALLDRQIPTESAFAAPATIAWRLGCEDLDADRIAWHDPGHLAALFAARPAVHAYPEVMARRVQELCRHLVARHGGRASAVWEGVATGRDLYRRVSELPGFGRQKTQIFVALLAKQYGVRPDGWREAAGVYGEDGVYRSVADVTGPQSLARVREYRQEEGRAAKEARSRPAGQRQRL